MISINRHSGIYTLEVEQFLDISLDEAWDFFSSPRNLSEITPAHMGFNITSDTSGKMYPGQIITYKIGLLPGIKSNWTTEITHVAEQKFFVDEQRFGPYAMWHHEHHFEKKDNGVLMRDKVSYKIPLGFIGHLIHSFFIRRQLLKIFSYRVETLNSLFGTLKVHKQI